jgi:RecB family endonuclease NucS
MAEASLSEAVIRDEIAARPEMIEHDLRTIATNYHLPNSEGTRGFVDVLTQDRRGLYVVIEVKRADNTAREALHEVLKYCELLRRESEGFDPIKCGQ